MKLTNLKGQWSASILKRLSMIICFVSMFAFGALQAQTPAYLGESASADITETIQNEVTYLQGELEDPPAGVDISWNEHLITSYTQVRRQFSAGQNLKQLMLNVLQGSLFSGTDDGSQSAKLNLTPSQEQQLDDIIQFVEDWNVTSRNSEDFNEALTLIRELKNQ